jgi:hypothetical protein
VDDPETAKLISDVIVKRADEELTYFIKLSKTGDVAQWGADNVQSFIQNNMRDLNMIVEITERNDQPLGSTYREVLDRQMASMQ